MPHTRHRALLPAVLATVLLAAGVPTHGQKPGAAAIAFDRYHSPQEINAALAAMNKANPTATALHAIATSPGGIVLTALEIGPEAGKKVRKLPAVFVVGNLEGVLPIATEAALYLADRLLQNAGSDEDAHLVHPAQREPGCGGTLLRQAARRPTSATPRATTTTWTTRWTRTARTTWTATASSRRCA